MMALLITVEEFGKRGLFLQESQRLRPCGYRRNKWARGIRLTTASSFDRWAAAESIVMLR